MKKTKLKKEGALQAVGVFIYVLLVSLFMNSANNIFGAEDKFLTPVAVLLLFIFSALVTGGLVLGRPIMFYLDNRKREGIMLLFYTGLSLFAIMLLIFIALFLLHSYSF